ncbi:AraC family transcriptional regulator [Kiritimatiellota bacterium B12222]|nr:AraC family transcriptional regulator [Kiritimatiellota bacterium B12222]
MNIDNQIRHDMWMSVEKQLVWAYQGKVDPAYRSTKVGKYYYALWYFIKGGVTVETCDGLFHAREGDCFLIPVCEHSQIFSEETELVSIRFLFNDPEGTPLLEFDQPVVLQAPTSHFMTVCVRLAKLVKKMYGINNDHLNYMRADFETHLKLDGHFNLFMRELLLNLRKMDIGLRPMGEMDDRVRSCIRMIRKSPPGKMLQESEMASQVGLSIGHLNRLFREQLGMTPHTWRNNYRYKQACYRLLNQESVKEVAYSLGFSSPQHFSIWFKQRSGHSPRSYKRKVSEGGLAGEAMPHLATVGPVQDGSLSG